MARIRRPGRTPTREITGSILDRPSTLEGGLAGWAWGEGTRTSTPDSLAAGVDYISETINNAPMIDPIEATRTPRAPMPTAPTFTAPKSPTIGDVGSAEMDKGLLASLRKGILTGAQVQGGARTFRGGGVLDGRLGKDATRLRIGKADSKQAVGKASTRKKQTNTLGLNLGSSVGLQV